MMDPKIIAQLILTDIAGRSGLGDALELVGDDAMVEMIDTWAEIIRRGTRTERPQ